jgi:membrane-associated phospholipid phosphatase
MQPELPTPSAPQAHRTGLPGHWLLVAAALGALGALVHMLPLNREWLLWMHRTPLLPDAAWALATLLAAGWAVLILLCVTDRGSEGGRAVLLAFVLGGVLSHALKLWFEVPRPGLVVPAESLHLIGTPALNRRSMPSGHATSAFTLAVLAIALLRRRGVFRGLEVAIWSVAVLMAASRVAVGAHWPADVLAGAGLGLLVGWVSWRLQQRWLRRGLWMSPLVPIVAELAGAWEGLRANEGFTQWAWLLGLQWLLCGVALASAAWRVVAWLRRRQA